MNECVINKVNYRYIAVTFASRLIIMYIMHDCGGNYSFFYKLHFKKTVHRKNLI